MSTGDIMKINAATVKLPTFTSADPFTWFVRSEAQFRSKNITRSQTKSDYILQALPEHVCNKIASFLRRHPSDIDYDELKNEILKKYSLQPSERVHMLLEMISQPLGDRTPRCAWDEMNRLLQLDEVDEQGNFKEIDLKRELWLQHLPEPIRAALHDSSTLSIEHLLTKADNLQISNRAILRNRGSKPVIASISESSIHKIESQYANLSDGEMNNDQNVSYVSRTKPRFSKIFQKRTPEFQRTPDRKGLCYYHIRWGQNARSCVQGCTWQVHSKN